MGTIPALHRPMPPRFALVLSGRLLYDTACVECHTTQAHWREKRLVRTRPDLVHQVMRWQAIVGQNWRREDVEDVAAYLNQQFYKLP